LIKNLALAGLETAINTYLQLDPDTVARLPQLADKVIALCITDWHIQLFILPQKNTITLLSDYESEPDTKMQADLCSFINIAKHKGSTDSLFKNNLRIEGDAHTGEQLRDILSNMDIDWEEHLSKLTGDVVAHHVFQSFNSLANFAKRAKSRLCENITEYVQEEKRWSPGKKETDDFFYEIRDTRDAVERLEARLQCLEVGEQA